MMEAFVNYYDKFRCIAHKCRHSCCIGWEIDIDSDTMEIYSSLDGELGERIRENIDKNKGCFKLKEDDRCPFLNEKGLCDIINEYGEDALCDICYLHPRFKNFYTDFTETGLGLCCEEAARIILSEEEKFFVIYPDGIKFTSEEKEFLIKRGEIFKILQNREKNIGGRFRELAEKYGININPDIDKLKKTFLSLERLDESWEDEINRVDGISFENDEYALFFEQLSVYFIFRHLKMKSLKEGVNFTLLSCLLIGGILNSYKETLTREKAYDIARMFSSEVEYSEENTGKIKCFNVDKEINIC